MAEKRDLINFTTSVGTTATEVLEYTPKRTYLVIQNRSENNIFIGFGDIDVTPESGLKLGPDSAYEPPYEVISRITVISDSNDTDIVILVNRQADPSI